MLFPIGNRFRSIRMLFWLLFCLILLLLLRLFNHHSWRRWYKLWHLHIRQFLQWQLRLWLGLQLRLLLGSLLRLKRLLGLCRRRWSTVLLQNRLNHFISMSGTRVHLLAWFEPLMLLQLLLLLLMNNRIITAIIICRIDFEHLFLLWKEGLLLLLLLLLHLLLLRVELRWIPRMQLHRIRNSHLLRSEGILIELETRIQFFDLSLLIACVTF